MNRKATMTTVGPEPRTSAVELDADDALFGLVLHPAPDGWTAEVTGPHLPPGELVGVTYQPNATAPGRKARP